MSAVVDRVKKMLEEKYSSDIVHVWYIDLINDNGQVFFLVQRKSSTPLSLDSNADVMFAEIDKTVGYESDRICGAMVYDYDENFLEKSSSKFMDFALCLDNDAVFKVI